MIGESTATGKPEWRSAPQREEERKIQKKRRGSEHFGGSEDGGWLISIGGGGKVCLVETGGGRQHPGSGKRKKGKTLKLGEAGISGKYGLGRGLVSVISQHGGKTSVAT